MQAQVLIFAALLLLAGCARDGRGIVAAQAPGTATGAGATLTGPTNAATASRQKSYRLTAYQPAPAAAPVPSVATGSNPVPVPPPSAPEIATGSNPVPVPSLVIETTETELGAHQDAAGIMKVAAAVSRWTWLRWVGVLCVLAGAAGWLWSMGNPLGYSACCAAVAGCGVFFILASDNPAWLLLLALPFLFYVGQKLGVIKTVNPS